MLEPRVAFIASVRFTKILDAGKNLFGKIFGHSLSIDGSPTTRQGGQVNEVQMFAAAMAVEIRLNAFNGNGFIQCLHAGEHEDGVIQIRSAVAILASAVLCQLTAQKFADEVGRVTEQTRGKAGDLKELETENSFASFSIMFCRLNS